MLGKRHFNRLRVGTIAIVIALLVLGGGVWWLHVSKTHSLVVREWGVRYPYPSGVTHLSYRIDASSNAPQVATIQLDDFAKDGCTPGVLLIRARADQNLIGATSVVTAREYQQDAPTLVKRIGDYYYAFAHGEVGCPLSSGAQAEVSGVSVKLQGEAIQALEAR